MSEFGDELVRSAQEAAEIARGTREPASIHVPGTTEERPGRTRRRHRPASE